MIFTDNLTFPEGPVALKDGSWLCVQGEPAGCVTHISANGKHHEVTLKQEDLMAWQLIKMDLSG